ncbi:hypothetical protein [Actinomyces viscosus]|uniref:hypothetical protein n=1 Tax=Actinomyces viscosus TaxID=1656 RepID=UPI000F825B85|nr:hypothetical protein [Actinomyces viscosus]
MVPDELARAVSLADECSAVLGPVSVEPGSSGDLGPAVLVAAAAAYATTQTCGARDGAAGADQIADGVKHAMTSLAEADESSASGARGLLTPTGGAGLGAGAKAGTGRGAHGLGAGR